MYDGSSPTAQLTAYVFETIKAHDVDFAKELDARGYDLTTLRFTVWPKSDGGLLPHGASHRLGRMLSEALAMAAALTRAQAPSYEAAILDTHAEAPPVAPPRFIVVPRAEVNGRPANEQPSEKEATKYAEYCNGCPEEFEADFRGDAFLANPSQWPYAVVDTRPEGP